MLNDSGNDNHKLEGKMQKAVEKSEIEDELDGKNTQLKLEINFDVGLDEDDKKVIDPAKPEEIPNTEVH